MWLYFNLALSYREVEVMLARRGIEVTYETIRKWCLKFGQTFATELRHRRPQPGDKWHLDEMVLKSKGKGKGKGKQCYLWQVGSGPKWSHFGYFRKVAARYQGGY